MPKIKTSELIGAALDWAVAKCEGTEITFSKGLQAAPLGTPSGQWEMYSTDWAQGGPIIEREGLLIRPQSGRTIWDSWAHGADNPCYTQGPTPLIAAMRCYVASKLGSVVEVPEELT